MMNHEAISRFRQRPAETGQTPARLRLKTWIIGPVALAMFAGLASYLGYEFFEARRESKQYMRRLVDDVESEWRRHVLAKVQILQGHLLHLARDPALFAAWETGDRDTLNALSQPLFSELKKQVAITHLYYVTPDRTCFLRVHQPVRCGDRIDRTTMLAAEQTGADAWGVELGPLAAFTLRYVRPWVKDGKIVGYLELGCELNGVAQEIAGDLNVDLVLLTRKKQTSREKFAAGKPVFGFAGEWDEYPDWVVSHQTLPETPAGLARQFAAGHDGLDDKPFRLQHEGTAFDCGLVRLRDVANRRVADLVVLHDVTAEVSAAHSALLLHLCLTAAFFAGILLVLWVVVGRAETQLSQAFAATRESESCLRAITDTAHDAIVMMDSAGGICYWNLAAERMLGYTREEALGQDLHALLAPPVFQELHRAAFPEFQRSGAGAAIGKTLELMARRKDGAEIAISLSLSAIPIRGRWHAVGLLRDETERKRIEGELRESEARFRSLFNNAVSGVGIHEIVLNEHGAPIDYIFLDVNAAFETQTGLTAARVLGRRVSEVLPGIEHTPLIAMYGQVVSTGEPVQFEQFIEPLQRHYSVSAYRVSAGRFATVFRDITARKRAEEELRAAAAALASTNRSLCESNRFAESATRAKSEFLANMSHEIRTPMTAILGYTDILTESLKDPGQQEALQVIRRNGDYLLSIINDILDISRIEAGKVEVERVACSPATIVRDVVSLMRVRASEKGIDLTLEYAEPCPQIVLTDPTRLRQILVNLVGNAIKFTESGCVRIIVHHQRRDTLRTELRCEIIDTGIGMTSEQIHQLFQPFHQADASVNRKFGGSGLGLAISKRLANLLGGDIIVRSQPGQGSTFTLTIDVGSPAGDAPMHRAGETAGRALPGNSPCQPEVRLNCRILLVEDGPDNRRFLTHVLKKAGAEVEGAEDGRQAVAAVATADPEFDIVLMDVQMPIMDGHQATRELRRLGYTRPIIALTAHAMAEDRERCFAAGCDDYLSKPIDRQQLLYAVASWVNKKSEIPLGTISSA